nr:hypothetical protein [Tanacetum cinerariifolium]
GEKIKEADLLIDQVDLPCDILSEDDVLPFPDNEDKVFNPGILIHEKSVKIITRFTQEKKLAVFFASLLFEDFDPSFYELLVFKEVPNSMRLLPFSSENKEKVFKPGIYTFKKIQLKPNMYDGSVIGKSDVVVVPDSEDTLMHAEESRSKMIEKQNAPQMIEKKVITKPIDYVALN